MNNAAPVKSMSNPDEQHKELEQRGWVILPAIVDSVDCATIAEEIVSALAANAENAIHAKRRRIVGGRNLLDAWDGWRRIMAEPTLIDFVRKSLGPRAGVVRILYFDKPPGEGWSLAIHQDRTIAVRQHVHPEAPFSKPTRKAGVPHVEASESLLGTMLTLRLHLDAMHVDNGPLVVAPGTHREPTHQTRRSTADGSGLETITCDTGDVFVMRPLLAHGSLAAAPESQDHRRVVHLELARERDLPGSYEWHSFEPLFEE